MRDRILIRTVRLTPYRAGLGPSFTLRVFDTGRYHRRGTSLLAYELRQHERGRTTILFNGEEYSPSPLHADDSDRSIAGLLGFLTLRPGDTDREYFTNYTPAQREFCDQHAEALEAEVYTRFGEA